MLSFPIFPASFSFTSPSGQKTKKLQRGLNTTRWNSTSHSGGGFRARGRPGRTRAACSARENVRSPSPNDLARSGRSVTFHASLWRPQLQQGRSHLSPLRETQTREKTKTKKHESEATTIPSRRPHRQARFLLPSCLALSLFSRFSLHRRP